MASTPVDRSNPTKSFTRDQRPYRERTIAAQPGATGKAVLVLRYTHNGKEFTRVWRGHSYYHVIKAAYAAATRVYAGRPPRTKVWGPRQDAFVRENYRKISTSQIAAELTVKFKRRVTKNMVISRYHRIKNHD